jgi:AcrR family transcriptional regulator
VTLRAVVDGLGVSTTAVYTYFDSMPGLWRAVRQEGFTRLLDRLQDVAETDDAVADFVALGAAYAEHALANPTLYRAMFDAGAELADPTAAAEGFEFLVRAATRARDDGRLAPSTDPIDVATRSWVTGHGLIMLIVMGVMPPESLDAHAPAVTTALLVAAGDDPPAAARSVAAGWRR